MLRRYLQNLLRTTRLDGLLAKHTEMLSEIKNLDSDMQMLVYENYNRFISATDTVRTMKSNVDGMDTSMQDLEQVTGVWHLFSDYLRYLGENSALLYSCIHVVQWGGYIDTMTGSCGQAWCHIVMTLLMIQVHHWHVSCRECRQQDHIEEIARLLEPVDWMRQVI